MVYFHYIPATKHLARIFNPLPLPRGKSPFELHLSFPGAPLTWLVFVCDQPRNKDASQRSIIIVVGADAVFVEKSLWCVEIIFLCAKIKDFIPCHKRLKYNLIVNRQLCNWCVKEEKFLFCLTFWLTDDFNCMPIAIVIVITIRPLRVEIHRSTVSKDGFHSKSIIEQQS